MLEAIDLCKVYKPKKGVPVTALNKISLKFPEKGMVFLLGKSGSGKSTLLNLLGGLDKYDSGEIIIKGVSSKNFKQQYFDSYRNTYVGFIFQEYNVLEEFSVGANIALALELRGLKATDEEINNILKEVDLEGYGNRKPNELSGGQKQRVAIARALVKNPEIIMADEPTGALDSNTGRQVFDTLKKLSKDKLVIIVSHDREFSELYADRIIELSDGNVISDVELSSEAPVEEETKENLVFSENIVEVAAGYHLTEEDRIAINNYIDTHSEERVSLKLAKKQSRTQYFKPTDQSKIKSHDGSMFKLIKSKLPLKSAFKIGASGLKHKKFRLVMTIILSCVAFGLFGLADTIGSYDHVKVCTNSLIDSNVQYLAYAKAVKMGQDPYSWWDSWNYKIKSEDIETMEKDLGMTFTGVFDPQTTWLNISGYFDTEAELSETEYNIYADNFSGFTEIDQDKLEALNLKLAAGRLPDGDKNEIAVSDYVYESFKIGGYKPNDESKADKISTYDDLIGRTLMLDEREYTITGIVDTGFDLDRYISLTEEKENKSTAQQLVDYALYNEFYFASRYGMACVAMTGPGHVSALLEQSPKIMSYKGDVSYESSSTGNIYGYIWNGYFARLEDIPEDDILWIDGKRESLGEKELVVSLYAIDVFDSNDTLSSVETEEEAAELLKDLTFNQWFYSYNDDEPTSDSGYKVVGIIKDGTIYDKADIVVVGDDNPVNAIVDDTSYGEYDFVVGVMPTTKSGVQDVVSYSYREDSDVRYEIQNGVTYELDTLNDAFKVLAKIFLFIGIGFAVFASLMLANFIGTSIAYKKQEIGILRAIGSRSNDVFRIFFSESFIIAMINFVLSTAAVFGITVFMNMIFRKNIGILISVLTFGPRQVLLLLVISVAVAAIASFIPVKKIASKKPIDAIRNR